MGEKVDLFAAVDFVKKFLNVAGHWPDRTLTFTTEVRSFLAFTLAVIFFVINLTEIIFHFSNFKDLAENMSVTSPVCTLIIKLSVFKIKRAKFLKMLDLIMGAKTFRPSQSIHRGLVKNMSTNCILLSKLYGAICSVVIIFYAVLSLTGETILPIKYNHDFGAWAYGMYVFQMSAIASVCFTTVCLDMLVVCFMGIAIAQLQVLEQKIRDFSKTPKADSESRERKNLKDCVVHHNEIIAYLNGLEDISNLFFLAQYLGSILSICNIGFQLANIQPLSVEFAKMVCFFGAMMWQLATFCWFGNEIIIKSLAVGDACYDTDWLKSSTSLNKSLLIVMIRANRQLTVTAGKFSILSLKSLASIMNASYSYFALMQRLYTEEQK